MLAVPAKLKTPDLLSITAPVHPELDMMRIIHDGTPNQVRGTLHLLSWLPRCHFVLMKGFSCLKAFGYLFDGLVRDI